MPLTSANSRKKLHTRTLDCEGFQREDGLWDIEVHLRDSKTYAFSNALRGEIQSGEPYHDLWLRVSLDDDLVIREIETSMDSTPFAVCPEVTPVFKQLIGVSMARGFRKSVYATVGGVEGCTHITNMLLAAAMTAYQTIMPVRHRSEEFRQSGQKPGHLNTCHALRTDGPVVRAQYPDWYEGEE